MSASVTIKYSPTITSADPSKDGVLIIGKLEHLKQLTTDVSSVEVKFGSVITAEHFIQGIEKLSPSPTDSVELWFKNFTVAALPGKASRHNAPMQPHALSSLVKSSIPRSSNESVVIVCERKHAFALGCAVPRVFPRYDRKKGKRKEVDLSVEFYFVDDKTALTEDEITCLKNAAESIQLTARIVDTPCSEMNTNAFVEEAKLVGQELNIEPMIIQDQALKENGFGGIYGVGKAAEYPPALVVLSHKPSGATKNIAWCGKGIVYDTGGLSIKTKTGMPGMKTDCGGAAAILGAFRAAVKANFKENLHAVFCLAENAVGERATRPDDVHTLYSGLTVEINNTDAEGRLVLGDGVAYAKKDLHADIIVDMATLTGAQGVATGLFHASILTNSDLWEDHCAKAGRNSGDLVFPVPYSPELHFDEFKSPVADMKNSVKNRSNAQVSCAGLFIGSHIGFDYPGVWLHVDMAAPATFTNDRATGFGVALLLALFGKYTSNPMLNQVSPEQ